MDKKVKKENNCKLLGKRWEGPRQRLGQARRRGKAWMKACNLPREVATQLGGAMTGDTGHGFGGGFGASCAYNLSSKHTLHEHTENVLLRQISQVNTIHISQTLP